MEKILIATILRPQGLNGELKCKLENNNYDVIKNVNEVYLNDKQIPTRVINKAFRNGYLFLTLSMVNSREKADLVRNFKVYADKKFINIPKDEYMISDLIDMTVYSEEGQEIGKLVDVQNFGAGDILIIEQYKREYMVPFIKDIFVQINTAANIIVVNKQKYNEAKICD
ncbi:MAG: 16S rRNA processing protein RimM [Clostridiales bacterium]|nr:16S rRNA processing protein RimM [Clostridiales bacterium]